MVISVYLPLMVTAVLAMTARPLRQLPPGPGSWALVAATVTAALGSLWVLLLLGASLVDDVPGVGHHRVGLPVSDLVSVVAIVLLGACLTRLGREVRAQRRGRAALRSVRSAPGGELVILPHPRAHAFAVAGPTGRVVLTDTMVRALDPAQRRVVIAHEQAHLAARHPLALTLGALAAAANPLLGPAHRTAAYLVERDADERAAMVVGDRRLVAETLTVAALARGAAVPAAHPSSPAFHRVGVLDRVAALHGRRRPGSRIGLVVLAAMVAVLAAADTDATVDFAALLARLFGR